MTVNRPNKNGPSQLRDRLKKPGILVMPGSFNAFSAKLVESQGFEGAYITGAGLINGMTGYPDIGLLSMTEITQFAAYIADAVSIPVICDADTGFGEALQVMRTVEAFERAGVAGIHIEDQVAPKRCGHLDGKQLIPIDAMQAKIRAACHARQNPDFMLIARVDARSVTGFDDAVTRANAYLQAGADMIFAEAMESKDEFRDFAKAVPGPLLANMTEFGKSPYLTATEFEALGYKIVIFPMTTFRVMAKAIEDSLAELKATGSQLGFLDKMQTRKALYELIDYAAYDAMDKGFS